MEFPKVFEKSYIVTDREAIHFMGPGIPPVLSTPSLVMWMEMASRENAASLLSPGCDTVGLSVQIRHLAPTPVGAPVKIISRLTQAEGQVYSFEIEAFDTIDKIGEAAHRRASVNVEKFADRVRRKKESLGCAG